MNVNSLNSNFYNKGHYQVGDQQYFSKFQAVMASKQTGHFPEWHFNNEIFGLQDWTQEPTESLWEIYRQRAQQLRDQYDYVILLYSGGSDSTNILQSFLFNNIPLDEVFCYGPFNGIDTNTQQVTTAAENLYREIDLVALPYLREMSKHYKFNVNMYDWTNDIINGFKDADWIWTDVSGRFDPRVIGKNKIFENSPNGMVQLEAGKKVCFIVGIDKPRIILKDGVFYSAFLDFYTGLGTGQKNQMEGKNWFGEELFYWSPDMPKLVIKQAHVMMQYFQNYPNKRYLVDRADLGSWKWSTQYFDLARLLMYPHWDSSTFQTIKPSRQTIIEVESWFINGNYDSKKYWLAGVQEAQKIIDPYWLTQDNDPRLVGSWSKWYKIGHI